MSAEDSRTYRTQWFERAQFEFHAENQPPYDVRLGHLGSEAFARSGASPTAPERAEFVPGTISAQCGGLLPSGRGVKRATECGGI